MTHRSTCFMNALVSCHSTLDVQCDRVGNWATDIINTYLEEPPGLQAHPENKHTEIASLGHVLALLGAKLTQDRQAAAQKIRIGIQGPPNAFATLHLLALLVRSGSVFIISALKGP